MSFALENQLKRAGQQQQRLTQRLNQQNPQPRIHRAQTRIQQLEYRSAETLRAQLSATRERFGNAVTHWKQLARFRRWRVDTALLLLLTAMY